ncbi:MAG: DUF72 domain-containing protein [Rhodospirillales bacterium]
MAGAEGGAIRIGVGGWTYAPWRGSFYPARHPQKDELAYASRRLTSIEINGTFYRTQKRETFRTWHDETPDNFVFAVKAPRYATTRAKLADAGASIERFLASGVAELRQKLGPINWQLMPTKKFDGTDVEAFFKLLPPSVEGRHLRHAIEVRHESFRHPEFVAMARAFGVAIVTAADGDYPLIADATAPFVYARLLGTRAEEPLGYAPDALDRWAAGAETWAVGGIPVGLQPIAAPQDGGRRDVYLYVISGHKVANPQAAMALIERIG